MKILILAALLLFSCTKETIEHKPTALAATSFFYAGATSTVSGSGLSADADVIRLSGGNYEMKSWWIAFYCIDTAGVPKWTQWGYGLHQYYGNVTIFTTWSRGVQIYPPTAQLAVAPFIFGAKTKFSIYNVAGTTKWRYARNNIDIMEVDLEATSLYKVEIMIESQSSTANLKWPLVNVKNISIYQGSWIPIPSAVSLGHKYNNTGLMIWPIQGQNQNSSLQKAELTMGGNRASVPPSTTLWQ